MRTLLTMAAGAVLVSAGAVSGARSECDSGAEVRKAMNAWRDSAGKAPFTERRAQLDSLAAKYPTAIEVQDERLSFYRWNMPEEFPKVREGAVKRAEANASDPLALTLAGAALYQSNTPKAIELLEKALKVSPGYPWAGVKLANIYASGKFENKEKARASFEVFANACPDRIPRAVEWLMGKVATPEVQARMARALRARLEKETDADELRGYETLWGLEFRTTPAQEHAALRKRVAADVERLKGLNLKATANLLAMLKNGAKQSGATVEELAAYDDRLLKEFPATYPAYAAAYERWKKDHKEPEDHKDKAAWDAWKKAYADQMKVWSAQFTEVEWLKDSYLSTAIDLGLVGEKEAVAMLAEMQRRELQNGVPSTSTYADPAGTLLDKGWAPEKALEWMEQAWPLAEGEDRRRLEDDTLTDERRKEIIDGWGYRGWAAMRYLQALLVNGKKEAPAALRTFVADGPEPAKRSYESGDRWARARLAAVEGRAADALAYYQAALLAREKAPQPYRGVVKDELLAEAKREFFKTGGTETAFALWVKPRETKPTELAEGRWEKATMALPVFELSDLSGKTWRLKQLEGKSLLINLWATWCGPCRSELPHLQKLYEKTKQQSEVQVMTFNIDEELGLVEPFMKENGYTFPVLMAYGFVRDLLDSIGIPQNWVVDPKGKWLWTQMGFDASDADWVNTMVKKLELAKEGK